MKQVNTKNQSPVSIENCGRSAMSIIMRAFGKVSTALKPVNQDLNFSRWQELECRDYRVSDRFDQVHDRRFK